jgi:GWxTD domain-containing protein
MFTRIRTSLVAALAAAIAVSAFALSPDHTEWGKGPATYLMTKEEIAQWKAISTDEQADKFIALFWARRDPTPATPRNEFREAFDYRVKEADSHFAYGRTRGSMSDRGKTLVLYGPPKKVEHTGGSVAGSASASGMSADQENNATYTWTYEEETANPAFSSPRAKLRFIDRFNNNEFRSERGGIDLVAAQQRAIQLAITQPNLTEPPSFEAPKPQAPAAPAYVPVAAPEIQTELKTEGLKTAVAEFKKSSKSASPIYATSGENVTPEGVTFAPVLVYVPKSSAPGANSTFFGVIEDASGKSVLAFEEPAKLVASKDDFFVDKSLTLPQGKYRGYFGIADGAKVAIAASDMDLAGSLDKDAPGASQLILSNNLFPLTEAQQPTDPYAFGGLKVVPKGDRVFHTTDELWYFVELRNPGIAEGATAPKVQIKLDVEGVDAAGKKTKMSAPPMEIDAAPIKGVANHYGIGSSIPLASFKPGDYTFNAKVIDTVKKSSYTYTEKFKVVQ